MYVTAPFSIVGGREPYNRRPKAGKSVRTAGSAGGGVLGNHQISSRSRSIPADSWRSSDGGIRRTGFQVLEDTVQSAEDLEKLLFIWQEATQSRQEEDRIFAAGEIHQKDGFSYTGFSIDETEN